MLEEEGRLLTLGSGSCYGLKFSLLGSPRLLVEIGYFALFGLVLCVYAFPSESWRGGDFGAPNPTGNIWNKGNTSNIIEVTLPFSHSNTESLLQGSHSQRIFPGQQHSSTRELVGNAHSQAPPVPTESETCPLASLPSGSDAWQCFTKYWEKPEELASDSKKQ